MHRTAPVALLLVLSLAATAAGAGTFTSAPPGFGPASMATAADHVPERPAFLEADPMSWLPAMATEGYLAGLRTLRAMDADGHGNESLTWHTILPLGDADGDDRADVVLVTVNEEDGDMVLEALSAGRPNRVLWTLEIDEDDEFIDFAGDFDEDGVTDLVRMSQTVSSYNGDTFSLEATAEILSGADLEVMTRVDLSGGGRFTFENSNPTPLLLGSRTYGVEADIPFLVDLWDEPGYAVVTAHIREQQRDEGYVVPLSGTFTFAIGTTVARHELSGDPLWVAGGPETSAQWLLDADGDGVEDLVFGEGVDIYTYEYDLLGDIVGLVQPREEDPWRTVTISVVDGADGATRWSTAMDALAENFGTYDVGNLHGDGPVLATVSVYAGVGGPAGFQVMTAITFTNARTGEARGAHVIDDGVVIPLPLGDTDGDGVDELALLRFGGSGMTVEAVRSDLSPVWKLRVGANDGIGLGDLDGDGVVDVVMGDDEITAHNGRDATRMWRVDIEDVAGGWFFEDVDLDGGADLALLDGPRQNGTYEQLHIELLSGATGQRIWIKTVLRASDYAGGAPEYAGMWGQSAGDMDGDGASDLLIDVYAGTDHDDCETCEDQEIHVAMAVDAADGHAFLRFDDARLAQGVVEVEDFRGEKGPAGRLMGERLDKGAPGAGMAIVGLALLGLVAVARRR